MRYPVMIEAGTDTTAWGVVVPDLPGCFSAADTLDEAMTAVEEAAAAWIDSALDAGKVIPLPSTVQAASEGYPGWIVAFVNVDPALLDDTVARVNITLPKRVLARIDAKAREAGESRSSFIAQMAVG
ncbi:MAG: type II toxin-antitoxin system HicB family antitoxin [Xanthomonadales bacterium]|nr:type II toxin-antitoxin system HicB family antitoxin [Xanthomonadales bacterium]